MSQITFVFDSPVAAATDSTVAFEIGWDFAHFGLTPIADHFIAGSPLRQGWEAARTIFGTRTLAPTRHTRKWLQLRLNAWQRGRMFEGLQVTPNYLRQIDVERCPITREALTQATCTSSDASIDRVRNDAGYAAGNLVVMSTRANTAKGDADFDDALAQMRHAEAIEMSQGEHATLTDGVRGMSRSASSQHAPGAPTTLSAAEWARIAVMCSFVTELPHAQAAALPLLVLPPNRLHLFNPIQALQALVTRQFEKPGWSTRIARFAELLPGKSLRRDFHVFVNALVPRVLEAGQPGTANGGLFVLSTPASAAGAAPRAQAMRWALEDAWRNALVLRCWKRVALQLDATLAERTVLRASALHLADRAAFATSFEQATDGWGLAQRGFASFDAETATATAKLPLRRPRPAPRTAPATALGTTPKPSAIGRSASIVDGTTASTQAYMFAHCEERSAASAARP